MSTMLVLILYYLKKQQHQICKFLHYKIRFRVDEPDYLNVPNIKNHDWEHTVYGKHEEDMRIDAPPPL